MNSEGATAKGRTVEDLPCPIDEIENEWIAMRDGCRLAARLWIPKDAKRSPVPALLEYLPYRKRDFTRSRDEPVHRTFASHGYACARVDIRGSGDSEGILRDEYSAQELEDALDVLAWLSAQPWCDGAVGMFGKSWGGFNALQVAALDPPQLKAVISVCASDDRYADDAHYMGGCLLNENLVWGSGLFTFNAYPPDPWISGPRWREKWLDRLNNATLFPALWLRHQRWDSYWRHGSVGENYRAIRCPVYAIGGWADAYTNAVPRLLAGLSAPRKGLIGPWAHAYPHDGVPGPAIGFPQEALRWWDHWLKGRDTGMMQEPQLQAWMQHSVPPRASCLTRPGRWVAEDMWPSAHIEPFSFYLAAGRLVRERGRKQELSICSSVAAGLAAGEWCPFSGKGDLPFDQRWDDAGSLTFDGAPLTEPMEILGAPHLELELAVDRPQAMIAVRLNDVAPDGASSRVTYGLLNLAHRDSREEPRPMVPGERVRVRVGMKYIAHRFSPNHRLRLSISTNYWPIAWPAPERFTLSVWSGASRLDLPVRPPSPHDEMLPDLPGPAPAPASAASQPASSARRVERDLVSEEVRTIVEGGTDEWGNPALAKIDAIELETGSSIRRCYRINESDPLSAQAMIERRVVMRRQGWCARVETRVEMTSTADVFRLEAHLRATEGDDEVCHRSWNETIPRDHL
jgi:uncharacterized protein